MSDGLLNLLGWGAAALCVLILGIILVSRIDWGTIESEAKKIMAKKGLKAAQATIKNKLNKGDYVEVEIGLTSGKDNIQFTVKSKKVANDIYVGQTRKIMA